MRRLQLPHDLVDPWDVAWRDVKPADSVKLSQRVEWHGAKERSRCEESSYTALLAPQVVTDAQRLKETLSSFPPDN